MRFWTLQAGIVLTGIVGLAALGAPACGSSTTASTGTTTSTGGAGGSSDTSTDTDTDTLTGCCNYVTLACQVCDVDAGESCWGIGAGDFYCCALPAACSDYSQCCGGGAECLGPDRSPCTDPDAGNCTCQ